MPNLRRRAEPGHQHQRSIDVYKLNKTVNVSHCAIYMHMGIRREGKTGISPSGNGTKNQKFLKNLKSAA